MIRLASPNTDIFSVQATMIVVPVNTMGAMGKGLVLTVAQRFPKVEQEYKRLCSIRAINTEGGLGWASSEGINFCLFPTKRHWSKPPEMGWIVNGLRALQADLLPSEIVAVPALGCGEGRLSWDHVRPAIEHFLNPLPNTVIVFGPR
jgi:O-acetyl-ADP-ribose deacetylase (regulator of RNase III)